MRPNISHRWKLELFFPTFINIRIESNLQLYTGHSIHKTTRLSKRPQSIKPQAEIHLWPIKALITKQISTPSAVPVDIILESCRHGFIHCKVTKPATQSKLFPASDDFPFWILMRMNPNHQIPGLPNKNINKYHVANPPNQISATPQTPPNHLLHPKNTKLLVMKTSNDEMHPLILSWSPQWIGSLKRYNHLDFKKNKCWMHQT